ncbi:uncharacterized protein [Procambarus clarkii]|uniref:uncharacterized protein n=1 Tax=Procambarus clarkii TaxID=6728 RepID=UPI00374308AC
MSRPSEMARKVKLEILLVDIFEVETQKVTTKDTLQAELIAEDGKTRGNYRSTILSPELKAAAKSLCENKEIVVRRGDNMKSPKEFVDLLRGARSTGTRASMDVESMFTNVPLDETIGMIADRVYRDPAFTPLDIPEYILRKLLQACTKEEFFLSPDGHMYKQVDGVAMGAPLSVLFANFYIGTIEQKVLVGMDLKPAIYCRFVDDIFMQVPDVRRLQQLKEAFEQNSVLSFTYEMENNGKLPFLDVTFTERNGGFHTAVYTKETNIGMCLNANRTSFRRLIKWSKGS